MKCPKCDAECWRDEHPDGYAVGPYNCPNCGWSEQMPDISSDIDLEDLPF